LAWGPVMVVADFRSFLNFRRAGHCIYSIINTS
jgi:hypothetical protein